jgi:hypothetical protein
MEIGYYFCILHNLYFIQYNNILFFDHISIILIILYTLGNII